MKKIFFSIIFAFGISAQAIERIDITNGSIEPMPIASVNFSGIGESDREVGKQITEVINNDLKGSGLFRIIDDKAYIETIHNVKHHPKFSAWRQINATALLVGEVYKSGDGIKVEYQLWDPFTETSLKGNIYKAKTTQWRRVAHKIADDIYKRITGEEGYFDTKILFISATGPAKMRSKRLAIMDQDGANIKYLSDGKNLTLTPRFSPDNHSALYLSLANHKLKVHLRNLNSGNDSVLGHFKGMTFAPRFAPNGKEVIMSATANGTTDIFLMELNAKKPKQLTQGNYINTSPYFSPDGEKIAFVSDRSGKPQIYVMNKDGSNQERITFGQGSYTTPIWSPRGDYILFTKQYMGTFYLGVIRPDGSGERIITQAYLIDSPSWAPNGRVIIYTKGEPYRGTAMASRSYLCTIDVTGNFERTLKLPTDASDPSWSSLLK
jgi:TolB protein